MSHPATPSASLRAILRPIARTSLAIAIVFLGGFGVWAAYAPLSSAAIAPGVVSPDSRRQTIQHLEGGIVEEILVQEGQRIAAGDLLVRLSPLQAQTSFSARQRQWQRFEAERLRLQALESGAMEVEFPPMLTETENPEFQGFLANQQALFAVERQGLEEKRGILGQRVAQLDNEIEAINRENVGLAEQLAIIDEEIADKQSLLDKQLTRKTEVLALQRVQAELRARIASNEATIARAEQKIAEVEMAALSLGTEFRDEIATDLARVNRELAQLEEAMISSEDIVRRTEIRAPISGTVLNLRFRTVGGIVRPGEPILDLVPAQGTLFIDARLSPNDIDMVAPGQPARIHLTPYSARDMPALDGELVRIDADTRIDEATQQPYYEVRIQVDSEGISRLATDVELTPGMPAEVFIVTGEQSLFDYMAAPVTRSFRRAFRED